ncbi:BppU family phage baseplate upper protein [Paenibacillus yanchengensis]|uniref:BppU family phage baseplate upper protein n=1 Tax=Paenibacillus yanchengensis TaxID=2035833 RepID=A0ABW4YP07_9BACL
MSSIVQHDNGTEIIVTITDNDRVVDLTAAKSIIATIHRAPGSKITKEFVIVDAEKGVCKTALTADDVSVFGTYTLQLTVLFNGGNVFSSERFRLEVLPLLSKNK